MSPSQNPDSLIISAPMNENSRPLTPESSASQPLVMPLISQQPMSSRPKPTLYDMIVLEPPPTNLQVMNTISQPASNAAESISYED